MLTRRPLPARPPRSRTATVRPPDPPARALPAKPRDVQGSDDSRHGIALRRSADWSGRARVPLAASQLRARSGMRCVALPVSAHRSDSLQFGCSTDPAVHRVLYRARASRHRSPPACPLTNTHNLVWTLPSKHLDSPQGVKSSPVPLLKLQSLHLGNRLWATLQRASTRPLVGAERWRVAVVPFVGIESGLTLSMVASTRHPRSR